MATTLKIKNTTAGPLTIKTGGAGGDIELAAGEEAPLTAAQLSSKGFAAALEAGSVSFVPVATPSQEEIALAEAVLPPLVMGMRDRVRNLKDRFDRSQKDLLERRKAYNTAWKTAAAYLVQAKAAVPGWPALQAGAKNLLLDTVAESPEIAAAKAEVESLEDEIDTLNNEDLAATGRTLQQWFQDRQAKEVQLLEARKLLEGLNAQAAHPLVPVVAEVAGAATAINALTQNAVIGQEIPEFGG